MSAIHPNFAKPVQVIFTFYRPDYYLDNEQEYLQFVLTMYNKLITHCFYWVYSGNFLILQA